MIKKKKITEAKREFNALYLDIKKQQRQARNKSQERARNKTRRSLSRNNQTGYSKLRNRTSVKSTLNNTPHVQQSHMQQSNFNINNFITDIYDLQNRLPDDDENDFNFDSPSQSNQSDSSVNFDEDFSSFFQNEINSFADFLNRDSKQLMSDVNELPDI